MGTYTESSETVEVIDAMETTFGLERDLQMALRLNIEQLEPRLTIIDGGKELTTEASRIDITAEDGQGATVIIELKAGTANPDCIAQILSYMGVLRNYLKRKNRQACDTRAMNMPIGAEPDHFIFLLIAH
jgi:RecB family endonuclease NucS